MSNVSHEVLEERRAFLASLRALATGIEADRNRYHKTLLRVMATNMYEASEMMGRVKAMDDILQRVVLMAACFGGDSE